MNKKPILFSTAMVSAILEGRKTQTRRTKGLDYINTLGPRINFGECHLGEHMTWTPQEPSGFRAYFGDSVADDWFVGIKCPYATHAGDLLWVREVHYRFGHWVGNGLTRTGKQKWKFVPDTDEVKYFDNPPADFRISRDKKFPHAPDWYKRLARFMPKEAARIFLRITDIRVERLQDITEEDAKAEGAQQMHIDDLGQTFATYRRGFQSLWESINGPESWTANPWTWCVSFERIDKPE